MLNKKTRYLQVALNSNLNEALGIIQQLPRSERILIEAGTPLIKGYGATAISYLKQVWQGYVVADLKTMDRGETEVQIAAGAGASGAIALGIAPIETINSFISSCTEFGLDSMLDMMNVDQPIKILRRLKKLPNVVILHRGVDEENFNKDKPVPYVQINKIRSSYNVLVSVAGGDTIREVQRAVFNDADIVVVWKEFYQQSSQTKSLVEQFLKAIK
ncbi:MAG: orotidine 5'-phosphate decarboxylase / HUMPS family protein [Patescibacteria group bacterium]